ncbi:MAG TPA: porin, partial [Bacteroidia bacterium]|nr:porin [Bacteroidia bacterium]
MKKLSTTKKTIAQGLFLCLLASSTSYAQFGDKMKKGLNFYLDSKDSSHFVKLEATTQLWARYTDTNPLTQVGAGGAGVVGNYGQKSISDVSVRRARLVFSGQLTDRIAFFTQFGENSMNYTSARKANAFFHDITIDYAVIKRYFSLGMGLNGWNGPTRFSNISVASIMVLDPPGFQEVTNDTYDQFVRRYGIYAKGKIGKLDYRLSAAKPFVSQTGSAINALNPNGGNTATTSYSTFSTLPPQLVYQGYLMYQFLDEESNFAPSTKGTYLGKKTIFNIGAGFYYQHNAMMLNTQPKLNIPQNGTVQAVNYSPDT